MGVQEKIKQIEEEMARTQVNKATEFHLGMLKARLAQLRRELITPKSTASGGNAFDIKKSGDATVAIMGLPSVGKSTLLTKITNAKSEIAAYAFTTLKCIPGILEYKGAKIQILDLPGIIEGAKDGKGRGREVIAVARGADLILMLLDAAVPAQYNTILKELYGFGIRPNARPPNIVIKKKARGGILINKTVKLTKLSEPAIKAILAEYKLHNCEITIRDDVNTDEFIDAVEGNRAYIPMVVAVNKIDAVPNLDKKKFQPGSIFVSAEGRIGTEELKETIYNSLRFIRIFTRRRGEKADLEEPLMMKSGTTIGEVCERLHRDLKRDFRYALVTGKSVKHTQQRVGLDHVVLDGDVIYIVKR
jgi:small GTP-binding protein